MTNTSAAQISANRANAQLSTGPVTPEGKAKMAANPLRHGLTSAQLIIPGEKESDFLALLAHCIGSYFPVGQSETELVQQIAEQEWRLLRIARVENATLTMYMREYLEEAKGNEALAHALAFRRHGKEFDRFMRYEKTIRNLHRSLSDSLAALQDYRQEREAEEEARANAELRRVRQNAQAIQNDSPQPVAQIIQSQPVNQNGSVSQEEKAGS